MPDWLEDPRVSKLPFMKLKTYMRHSSTDLSRKELDGAGTKFALLHMAEEKKIALENLFDELGPKPPPQSTSTTPRASSATGRPSPRQSKKTPEEVVKTKAATATKAAEEAAKAKAVEASAKARAAKESTKAQKAEAEAKAKKAEAVKAKSAEEAAKAKAAEEAAKAKAAKAAVAKAAAGAKASKTAAEVAAAAAGLPTTSPPALPAAAALAHPAAAAASAAEPQTPGDTFRRPQTTMNDQLMPTPLIFPVSKAEPNAMSKSNAGDVSERLTQLSNNFDQQSSLTTLHEDTGEDVTERLFASVGESQSFAAGQVIITEGVSSMKAMFVRSGEVSLRRGTKEVKRAGPGFVIGEMTLLLGDQPNVSVVADTAVEAYVVSHSALITALQDQPRLSGMMFKKFAVLISERIGETSKRARDEVVVQKPKSSSVSSTGKASVTSFTPHAVEQAQKNFKLPATESLRFKTAFDSVQKEANAMKEDEVQYGQLFIFEKHLCFEYRIFGFVKQQTLPFADVIAVLNIPEKPKEIEVQGKGFSYYLSLPKDATETWGVMEACRRAAGAEARRETEQHEGTDTAASFEQVDAQVADAFNEAVSRATSGDAEGDGKSFLSVQLTDDDWSLFLSGAKQRRYKHGEFVLKEGETSAALFEILQGTVRVELQLKDQPTAVIVGHRGPGEMFGETSLLKEGHATASIVVESEEATLVCVEGAYLEKLFTSHPSLPGRFFAFLATYQAGRLRRLTASITSGVVEVAGHGAADVPIETIFSNPAFLGIFQTFLFSFKPEGGEAQVKVEESRAAFQFCNDVREKFKTEPNHQAVQVGTVAARISTAPRLPPMSHSPDTPRVPQPPYPARWRLRACFPPSSLMVRRACLSSSRRMLARPLSLPSGLSLLRRRLTGRGSRRHAPYLTRLSRLPLPRSRAIAMPTFWPPTTFRT